MGSPLQYEGAALFGGKYFLKQLNERRVCNGGGS